MKITDKAAYIRDNGLYVSMPQGNSMWPFIRGTRDSVAVVPPDERIRKYDVILYVGPGGVNVMHRVIGMKNGVFVVRGDNCFYREYVRKEKIMGVAERIFRDGKTVRKNRGAYLLTVRFWRLIYPVRSALFHIRNKFRKLRARKGKEKE